MKERILVVDDDSLVMSVFESILLEEGYRVISAQDYHEALVQWDETSPDLIFVDILLGSKTGIDVLRAVRERSLHCPVVMITGNPDVETASEALRLGAFDYIFKPVQPNTLLRVTHMALQHKRLHDEKERYRSNLEAIFRSVKDAIITVDQELVVLELNEAAQNLCGFSREAIGKADSSGPMAVPSSWTRSGRYRPGSNCGCSGCFRRRSLSGWRTRSPSRWMCGWWRPPTGTFGKRSGGESFGRISTTG